MIRLSVPGNILLAGEYAVTETGHLGLCLAVDPRVRGSIEAAQTLTVRTLFGGESHDHELPAGPDPPTPDEGAGESPPPNLVTAASMAVRSAVSRFNPRAPGATAPATPGARITIDSTDFYRPDGGKIGLGSSAAVSVALSAALLRVWLPVDSLSPDFIFGVSLETHRVFQGGRGSGYDVAASVYGGAGLLVGGTDPVWRPVELPWLSKLYLRSAPAAVHTTGALARYETWKTKNPEQAARFLAESDAAVERLTRAEVLTDAAEAVEIARELGIALGAQIGVSADIGAEAQAGIAAHGFGKAVGAGNELAMLIADGEPAVPGWREHRRTNRGLRWE